MCGVVWCRPHLLLSPRSSPDVWCLPFCFPQRDDDKKKPAAAAATTA